MYAPIYLSPTWNMIKYSDDAILLIYYLNQILFARKFMVHNCWS